MLTLNALHLTPTILWEYNVHIFSFVLIHMIGYICYGYAQFVDGTSHIHHIPTYARKSILSTTPTVLTFTISDCLLPINDCWLSYALKNIKKYGSWKERRNYRYAPRVLYILLFEVMSLHHKSTPTGVIWLVAFSILSTSLSSHVLLINNVAMKSWPRSVDVIYTYEIIHYDISRSALLTLIKIRSTR